MTKPPLPETAFWRYPEASSWLGLPRPTLRQLVHRKQIPHHRLADDGRIVLFDPAELRAWMDSRKVAAK